MDRRGIVAGWLVIAISVLHTVVGVQMGRSILRSIWAAGVFNGVGQAMDRMALFWFLFFGVLLAAWGHGIVSSARNARVPSSVGWWLVGVAIAGGSLIPASGFWLALIPGGVLLTRRAEPTEQASRAH